MEIRTIKQDTENNEPKGKVIRKSYIAKALLHCEPRNTIIDIKVDRDDPDKKRTVFVFEDNEKFQKDLSRILKENEEYRREREIQREVEARLKKIREEAEGE